MNIGFINLLIGPPTHSIQTEDVLHKRVLALIKKMYPYDPYAIYTTTVGGLYGVQEPNGYRCTNVVSNLSILDSKRVTTSSV